MERFVKVVKNMFQGLASSDGKAHFIQNQDDKKRKVGYLDTIDSKIRDNSFLLRIRKESDDEYVTVSLLCVNDTGGRILTVKSLWCGMKSAIPI